jgi:hypothetical protein
MARMRAITPDEAQTWTELAQKHSATDAHGSIAPGRFITHQVGQGVIELELVTPLVAGEISEQLKRKDPPIMFDRTATGELVIPIGRWLRDMFEYMAEDAATPDDVAEPARLAGHGGIDLPPTVLLPANTDTIEFVLPGESGEMVSHEALPPGGRITLRLEPKKGKAAS